MIRTCSSHGLTPRITCSRRRYACFQATKLTFYGRGIGVGLVNNSCTAALKQCSKKLPSKLVRAHVPHMFPPQIDSKNKLVRAHVPHMSPPNKINGRNMCRTCSTNGRNMCPHVPPDGTHGQNMCRTCSAKHAKHCSACLATGCPHAFPLVLLLLVSIYQRF